jgi:hypothetical protein
MVVIWYGIMILALANLGLCWYTGDVSLTTKLVFTLLYVLSFPLLLIPDFSFVFYLAQLILAVVIGVATFGLNWLIGDR